MTNATARPLVAVGSDVSYQYRVALPNAPLVRGTGTVIAETIVGVDRAWVIQPHDGSDCVHVRASRVWVREQ